MQLICLDLEGVLVPEIWIEVAGRTGIDGLKRTTRDEPDYDTLMRYRLGILAAHDLRMPAIQDVIASMGPLPGAREFLDRLRARYQVIILSDTFYEFAAPLMRQLGLPTLFCHRLLVDGEGRVTGYRLRMKDQKRAAVTRFRELAFNVIAAGDSYNDTSMLGAADRGFFFCPPPGITEKFPDFPVTLDYAALGEAIDRAAAELATSEGNEGV